MIAIEVVRVFLLQTYAGQILAQNYVNSLINLYPKSLETHSLVISFYPIRTHVHASAIIGDGKSWQTSAKINLVLYTKVPIISKINPA